MIYAPPGSGYATLEDEESELPSTYEPMMAYPGTMRPGKTPENMPYQDLPIGDDDPDPVPWPHFQQIEWHHRWPPPHDHPIPMEQFIELQGRWATPEMEAAMRAGVRRGVRERRQMEEEEKLDTIITDDDDDDDDDDDELTMGSDDDPVALGDGIFGQLGSDADRAATAAAVDPKKQPAMAAKGAGAAKGVKKLDDELLDDGYDDDDEGGIDNFLLDLGLDLDLDADVDLLSEGPPVVTGASKKSSAKPAGLTKQQPNNDLGLAAALGFDDDDDDDDDVFDVDVDDDDDDDGVGPSPVTATIKVDDDEGGVIDLSLDDDDDIDSGGLGVGGSGDALPLDDFGSDSDTLDTEDIFDEGGFDFDDGDDFGSGGDDDW
jgi:hypothetical protein